MTPSPSRRIPPLAFLPSPTDIHPPLGHKSKARNGQATESQAVVVKCDCSSAPQIATVLTPDADRQTTL
jgi:hypothetical protein